MGDSVEEVELLDGDGVDLVQHGDAGLVGQPLAVGVEFVADGLPVLDQRAGGAVDQVQKDSAPFCTVTSSTASQAVHARCGSIAQYATS